MKGMFFSGTPKHVPGPADPEVGFPRRARHMNTKSALPFGGEMQELPFPRPLWLPFFGARPIDEAMSKL